jgi:uridine kinase
VDNKTRLERRINRDVKERGRSENEIKKRYQEMCKPMYDEFILPSKIHADIVSNYDQDSIGKIINLISKKFE